MKEFKNDQDKEAFVQNVFSNIAKRYDSMNTILSLNQDKRWRKAAIEYLGLKGREHLLDVACGTCSLTISALKKYPKLQVDGLDFNQDMLNVGKSRLEKYDFFPQITLTQGDAMNLPYEDNFFDGAMSGFALRNVPNVECVLREMKRVVKPGGRIVTLELAKPSMPLFKQLYYAYFEKILPWLGSVGLTGETYRWLPESLRRYPHQQEILKLFDRIGLIDTHYEELTGGIVAIHVGTVPNQ